GVDLSGSLVLDAQAAGLVAVDVDDDGLDVEHDVGDVLEDAFEGAEFVVGPRDAGVRDRGALEAAEQDAAEAVADGGAEAALKRLDREAPVDVAAGAFVANHTRGKFESTPSNTHVVSS